MKNGNVIKICIQFLTFGLVGISNTLISYLVFAVLVYFNVHYIIANAVAFLVSVLNAFYWNNKCVFKEQSSENKRNLKHALIKCICSYSVNSLFLATALLFIWVNCLKISPYIGQMLNLVITIPLNFLINKYWAFK